MNKKEVVEIFGTEHFPAKILAEISEGNEDESEAIKKYFMLIKVIEEHFDQLNNSQKAIVKKYLTLIKDDIIPEEMKHIAILSDFIEELSRMHPEQDYVYV